MNIVILGGGGNIGYWVENALLVAGYDVYSVKRGRSGDFRRARVLSDGIKVIYEDVNAPSREFIRLVGRADVVIDFICYDQDVARERMDMLTGFCGVYMLVSTVSVYSRHDGLNVLASNSEISNIRWKYARKKYEAENAVLEAFVPFSRKILRLGHTYDTALPVPFGPPNWLIPQRIMNGRPLLVHRRGLSSWPLLHSIDVAKRIVLVARYPDMFSDVINVVGLKLYSWDDIAAAFFYNLSCEKNIRYIPPNVIASIYPYWGDSVVYHKQYDEMYVGAEQETFCRMLANDMSLIEGLRISLDWYFDRGAARVYSAPDFLQMEILEKNSVEMS